METTRYPGDEISILIGIINEKILIIDKYLDRLEKNFESLSKNESESIAGDAEYEIRELDKLVYELKELNNTYQTQCSKVSDSFLENKYEVRREKARRMNSLRSRIMNEKENNGNQNCIQA